jgi:hypothetical protein
VKHGPATSNSRPRKVETLDPASVANSRRLSDAHNPVAVAGFGYPVCATLSPPFPEKCDDNGPTACYDAVPGGLPTARRTSSLGGLQAFVVMKVVVFGCHGCRWRLTETECYTLLLRTVISRLPIRRANTPHSTPFFNTWRVTRSDHHNTRTLTVVASYESVDWNDCFARLVVLPRSCHTQCCYISLKKQLPPYTYMNVSTCLCV